jgi:hypothetical protein
MRMKKKLNLYCSESVSQDILFEKDMSLGIIVFSTNLFNQLLISYPGNQIWQDYKVMIINPE